MPLPAQRRTARPTSRRVRRSADRCSGPGRRAARRAFARFARRDWIGRASAARHARRRETRCACDRRRAPPTESRSTTSSANQRRSWRMSSPPRTASASPPKRTKRIPRASSCCYDRGRSGRSQWPTKECPMCGEMMRLREREVTDRVPGTHQTKTAQYPRMGLPGMRLLRGSRGTGGLRMTETRRAISARRASAAVLFARLRRSHRN